MDRSDSNQGYDYTAILFCFNINFKGLLSSATNMREGYIFTAICQSFCSQGGVCLSACWDTHPLAGTPLRQVHPLGRYTSREGTPPRSTPPNGHCSRWYASYWNAFFGGELIFLHNQSIGGSKGAARDACPLLGVQILSFSCSFWEQN